MMHEIQMGRGNRGNTRRVAVENDEEDELQSQLEVRYDTPGVPGVCVFSAPVAALRVRVLQPVDGVEQTSRMTYNRPQFKFFRRRSPWTGIGIHLYHTSMRPPQAYHSVRTIRVFKQPCLGLRIRSAILTQHY